MTHGLHLPFSFAFLIMPLYWWANRREWMRATALILTDMTIRKPV